MATVIVQEGQNIDAAIHKFKKVCLRDGILKDLKRKEFYEKPATIRKKQKNQIRKNKLKNINKMLKIKK